MTIISVLIVTFYAAIMCIVEIPKMLKDRLIKELIVFSVLVAGGAALAIMKTFNVEIPRPTELVMRIYSPVSDLMKSLSK